MDSSPSRQGSHRPSMSSPQQPEPVQKPSLLPAFEPLSSSPFPRPQSAKRKYVEDSPSHPKQELKYYPTPVPTSSTGILPSSPTRDVRPGLQRTMSTLSERVPLGALPTIDLPSNGEPVRMGRSSNSSDYQLSANRLISRVHVQAAYRGPNASSPNGQVVIECLGWNGVKVHFRGQVHGLSKGQSFVSDKPEADIMLDVQDARVLIGWPFMERKLSLDSQHSDSTWNEEASPLRQPAQDHFASSPPFISRSPVPQSPIRQPDFTTFSTFLASDPDTSNGPVQVYEDADAVEEDMSNAAPVALAAESSCRPSLSRSASANDPKVSQPIGLSSFQSEDFSDGDEENDPIIHSFGPFGENLLPRMASFSASSNNNNNNNNNNIPTQPQRRRRPLTNSRSPQQRTSSESTRRLNESPIKNHVINQLAFSRLHSIPLSTILGNLPAELKAGIPYIPSSKAADSAEAAETTAPLTSPELKHILDNIPCVGEINREGKDAAGKPLENEFYYVPEMDSDQVRRDAVVGGIGGSGLRAVRKSHKQYYWKRPRN
ncbi:hypothetical protein K432DRAFT_290935 [Lepidopterella palustris CBS 459.81]|uniref:FHA domain-containing protein n=1 Tax=Lepidopterella palustris CBS 459.81 TaxID=1314670 RepID=A0A8E2JI66_9PEZI|nr:hypothetical protein K432DRAFT_290935 [Lepidopterella palustris CBS 459.81]